VCLLSDRYTERPLTLLYFHNDETGMGPCGAGGGGVAGVVADGLPRQARRGRGARARRRERRQGGGRIPPDGWDGIISEESWPPENGAISVSPSVDLEETSGEP